MKRLFISIWLTAMLLAVVACDTKLPGDPPYTGPAGTYAYTAFDSSGVAVVTGWFKLAPKDSIQYTGEWHFKEVAKSHPVGPQIGDGELVGGIEDGRLWVNLNPNMADNNVFLNGQLDGSTYTGQWSWSTFVGPTTGGKFEAMRK